MKTGTVARGGRPPRRAGRRLVRMALVGWAAAHAPASAVAEPPRPVVLLREAVAAGTVEARGERPEGYHAVTLVLANRADHALAVDVCGAQLVPTPPRSCQRLGLGPKKDRKRPPRPQPGGVVIDLAVGQTVEVALASCCLDVRLPAPTTQTFAVAPTPPLPAVEAILRWWADHPEASQGAVNGDVWTRSAPGGVHGVVAAGEYSWRQSGASFGDVTYQIVEGALTSVDADRVRRVLASDVVRVIPRRDALYAVFARGDTGGELRRLAATGADDDAWDLVATLGGDDAIVRQVEPIGDAGLLVATAGGLGRVARGTHAWTPLLATARAFGLTMHVGARGPVDVATFTDHKARAIPAVGALDRARPIAADLDEMWELTDVAVGPAGCFGLTAVGRLKRIEGGKAKDVGEVRDVAQVLAVGQRVVWVAARDRVPRPVDPSTGRAVGAAPTGSGEMRLPEDLQRGVLDPSTDALLVTTTSGWTRWLPDGRFEDVPGP